MQNRYRWTVVAIFFVFMLLHQADKLLIGPLLSNIKQEFQLTEGQAGALGTGALIIGAILYPIWGYLYDRYARAKLLALASLIWGVTTWLGAIARTYPTFLAARASTGIDDSSYPGIYSLVADYFPPSMRGRVYGILQLSAPLGYLIGLVLALVIGSQIGWRNTFFLTGSLGIVLAVVIFFFVKEQARGKGEPELQDLPPEAMTKFSWQTALQLFRKRALIPLFIQGFFGVFPLNIFSFWFFNYLESERGYTNDEILPTMAFAVIAMALGAFVAGTLGDFIFKRNKRGRLIVATVAIIVAICLLIFTMNLPIESKGLFGVMLAATAFLLLWAGPNVASSVYDITLPEVRSTALAVQYFIEQSGAASAPLLVGLLADQFRAAGRTSPLGDSILLIAVVTYAVCGAFLILSAVFIPREIDALREQLRQRAAQIQKALS